MSHQVAATFLRAVASAIATKHEDAMTAAQRRVDVGEAEADQVPFLVGGFACLGFRGGGKTWDPRRFGGET